MNMLDKWLAYFSDKTTEEERYDLLKGDKIMSLVAAAENKFFGDEEHVLAYLSAEKAEKDAKAALDYATDKGRNERDVEHVTSMFKKNLTASEIANFFRFI